MSVPETTLFPWNPRLRSWYVHYSKPPNIGPFHMPRLQGALRYPWHDSGIHAPCSRLDLALHLFLWLTNDPIGNTKNHFNTEKHKSHKWKPNYCRNQKWKWELSTSSPQTRQWRRASRRFGAEVTFWQPRPGCTHTDSIMFELWKEATMGPRWGPAQPQFSRWLRLSFSGRWSELWKLWEQLGSHSLWRLWWHWRGDRPVVATLWQLYWNEVVLFSISWHHWHHRRQVNCKHMPLPPPPPPPPTTDGTKIKMTAGRTEVDTEPLPTEAPKCGIEQNRLDSGGNGRNGWIQWQGEYGIGWEWIPRPPGPFEAVVSFPRQAPQAKSSVPYPTCVPGDRATTASWTGA